MGSGGQGLGRLCGWKRVERERRWSEGGLSWLGEVVGGGETLTLCFFSQPLQCSPTYSPERGCSRVSGPSAQMLPHCHSVPPQPPSMTCSCCLPSLETTGASIAEPGAAKSLWGERWHMFCQHREECHSPVIPVQHLCREREGQDSLCCCSHPMAMPRYVLVSPGLWHARWAWPRASHPQDTHWQCFERHVWVLWDLFLLAVMP